ncbi:MAG: glutaminyl-peptide cyclotransferase [Chloroflexota bacterium]|jgi:glutaminyl-peptide cyclotransferase
MKLNVARFFVLIPLLLFLLIACDGSPASVATLAPTASVPTEIAQETNSQQPDLTSLASPETSVEIVVEPSATPIPPPTHTPTPIYTPTALAPRVDGFEIVNTYPHDPNAWTQGLVLENGILYEGTGRWGQSELRQVALESGLVIRSQPLEDQYFGEGITIFGDQIYQLTWQEGTGFIYDKNSFERIQTFAYPHEGWGITHDGRQLIVSDGTPTIRFWNPDTLQETSRINVYDNNGPVNRLNELEYVDGEIWANIWLTDQVARIDPETGWVNAYIDLTGLLDTSNITQPVDVLNGIAYDSVSGRLFVTGKLWPTLFEIRVVPGS